MAQNIYDDPEFLAGYSTLDRQVHGLDGAGEWPTMQSLLPEIDGARVLDLGCGFGWFTRWATENGAASALGIDLSERMLERARLDTDDEAPVEYVRADLDDLSSVDLPTSSFELVHSSLSLHYVADLPRLLDAVGAALAPGGSFVFSVEHPIYSAPSSQRFESSEAGTRIWPLENYLVEGQRITNWFADGIVKQHRTIATHVNDLVGAGFTIERLVEWGPTADEVEREPSRIDDLHRPWFLLVRATKR